MTTSGSSFSMKIFNQALKLVYQTTGGRAGHRLSRFKVLLLTTTGRKTGRMRTTPLIYMADGERLVVVASNAGRDKHPAWYLNATATPRVYVQYGRSKGHFTAHTASPEERAKLWPRLVVYQPRYEAYQRNMTRQIPIVILEPYSG